jgi:hypothetical protein
LEKVSREKTGGVVLMYPGTEAKKFINHKFIKLMHFYNTAPLYPATKISELGRFALAITSPQDWNG